MEVEHVLVEKNKKIKIEFIQDHHLQSVTLGGAAAARIQPELSKPDSWSWNFLLKKAPRAVGPHESTNDQKEKKDGLSIFDHDAT